MNGVRIIHLDNKNPRDERGTAYEVWKGLSARQITAYTRKAGAVFGQHFHTGSDPAKDPELFFLIAGSVELRAEDGVTGDKDVYTLTPGDMLEIDPGIWHELTALTDAVFIEHRSTEFDPAQSDTIRSKEAYEAYVQTKRGL